MKLKTLVIICFLLAFSANAQNPKKEIADLLSASKRVYDASGGFKFNMNYKLYHTYNSNIPAEEYNGVFVTKDNMSYTKIGDTELVNLSGHFLHIDNGSKLLDHQNTNDNKNALLFFDTFDFIGKFRDYSVKKEGNYIICTMSSGEITFVPYSKVEIYIDSTTKLITKQVMYLLVAQQYKDSQGNLKQDYPKIEVSFDNFQKRPFSEYDIKFDLANYLRKAKDKYEVAGEYKGYTIVDSKN